MPSCARARRSPSVTKEHVLVKIRLARFGSKKNPHYRMVVADSRAPRDGRNIETVGRYNPRTEPSTLVVKEDRVNYWLGVGAQPSERVAKLLKLQGIEVAASK
jgi:small subunit ribosomal protein S16